MKMKRLATGAIDSTDSCLFWAQEPVQALIASMKSAGQLEPVLVDFSGERPVLVAGYSRFKAAELLGLDVLVAELDPAPVDAFDRGLLYLSSNMGREFSERELCAALAYFAQAGTRERIEQEVAPLLDLSPRSRVFKRLLACAMLPGEFPAHVIEGRIPLAAVDVLQKLPKEDVQALEPFFNRLSWSRNGAVNIITWLWEAGQASGTGITGLLQNGSLLAILDEELSPKDTIQKISTEAREIRMPTLVRLEQQFQGMTRELCAGIPWRMQPTRGFETGAVEMSVSVSNRAELERAMETLAQSAASPLWEKIWAIGGEE